MTRRPMLAIAVLLAAALGGCSGSATDPAPVENQDDTALAPAEPRADVVPTASSPTPTAPVNAAEETPPEKAPGPDEQMMDDAAATGMTARTSRDLPATDDAAPAEQVEKK